jgi:hypothetical protein
LPLVAGEGNFLTGSFFSLSPKGIGEIKTQSGKNFLIVEPIHHRQDYIGYILANYTLVIFLRLFYEV